MLTNVMTYWLTGASGSPARVGYVEDSWVQHDEPSGAPASVAVFAEDAGIRRYAERAHTIAAMEEPVLLVEGIRAYFCPMRGEV